MSLSHRKRFCFYPLFGRLVGEKIEKIRNTKTKGVILKKKFEEGKQTSKLISKNDSALKLAYLSRFRKLFLDFPKVAFYFMKIRIRKHVVKGFGFLQFNLFFSGYLQCVVRTILLRARSIYFKIRVKYSVRIPILFPLSSNPFLTASYFIQCRSTPARQAANPYHQERHPFAQGKTHILKLLIRLLTDYT